MTILTEKERNFNEKVFQKMEEIKKDPQKILTENMSGKMEGCKSISSSCAHNTTCQARIQWEYV